MSDPRSPAVAVIVGATAVGKSTLAMHLAEALGAEIVSLDSRQVYRGMDIGTAKPTREDRARVPHHLIDIADPDHTVTLPEALERARAAVRGVLARGRLPVLVGGTGQYVWAFVEGWRVPQVEPNVELRARLEDIACREGPEALHAHLAEIDPVSAERIDPRNVRRVARAIEVTTTAGTPFSELRTRAAPPYRFVIAGLALERSRLFARIDARLQAMIDAGLEGEVRRLVGAGYGFDLPSMSGLGYGEWRRCLDGGVAREEVVRSIARHTRRLARHQATWFRSDDPRIDWFDALADGAATVSELSRRLG